MNKPADEVLDFGLAAMSQPSSGIEDFSNSPTLLSNVSGGMLLGTAAYMSPEQACGKVFDRKSDVWAFGCLLYEMITGRQLFGGETVSDSIAKVLEREPDWSAVAAAPAGIRTLLRRCLQKNRGRRLRDLGDALIELEDIAETPGAPELQSPATAVPRSRRVWVFATLFFAAASVVIATLYL